MIEQINGQLAAGKGKYAIVVSRFNDFITSKLLEGAIDGLRRHGASDEQMYVVWVPGACEITLVAKKLAESGGTWRSSAWAPSSAARPATTTRSASRSSAGVGQINYDTGVPTIFGVLTCENLEQAIERAGTKMGNAGANAAVTAMEMAHVMQQIG